MCVVFVAMYLASQELLTIYNMHFDCHVKQYLFTNAGKTSFTLFGPTPWVMIPDPELVREIMSNKFGHFKKQRSTRIGKLLANGLTADEIDEAFRRVPVRTHNISAPSNPPTSYLLVLA